MCLKLETESSRRRRSAVSKEKERNKRKRPLSAFLNLSKIPTIYHSIEDKGLVFLSDVGFSKDPDRVLWRGEGQRPYQSEDDCELDQQEERSPAPIYAFKHCTFPLFPC